MYDSVKKNMFEKLPTDLLHIIWYYAYKWRLNCDPWKDVLLVLDIQQSIPSVFLRDRLPTKDMYGETERHIWQIYPLSPFKKNNPYLPSTMVEQHVPMPWSHLPGEIFNLLTNHGVHNLKTYRRVLHRKYNQHINRSVFEWNDSFRDLFGDVRLCQLQNYNLKQCNGWVWEFKNVVLKQLSEAKFLTTV